MVFVTVFSAANFYEIFFNSYTPPPLSLPKVLYLNCLPINISSGHSITRALAKYERYFLQSDVQVRYEPTSGLISTTFKLDRNHAYIAKKHRTIHKIPGICEIRACALALFLTRARSSISQGRSLAPPTGT